MPSLLTLSPSSPGWILQVVTGSFFGVASVPQSSFNTQQSPSFLQNLLFLPLSKHSFYIISFSAAAAAAAKALVVTE